MAKFDEMSFSKAFAAARKEMGAGKTFTWKGKSYTTNLKEEAPKKASAAPATSKRPAPAKRDAMAGYRAGDVTTSKITKPTSGRGDGGMEMVKRTAELALQKAAAAPKASTGGPARTSSTPNRLSMTNKQRMDLAKEEAAAKRAKSRAANTAPAKSGTAAKSSAKEGYFDDILAFIKGGGYTGYKNRNEKK